MDINKASSKLLRTLLPRLLALLALLTLAAGPAQAGSMIKFNGGNVAGCTRSNSSYSCAALPYVNYDDSIVIASGISVTVTSAVTIGYSQGLTMSGTAALTANGNLDISGINPSVLSITGGSLTANGGTFSMGAQAQTITANISASTINLGTGSTTKVTGSLTATGAIALGSYSTVVGPIVGASVTSNSPVTINGNVTVTNGFQLASGSSMTGNVSAATVTIDPSSVTLTGSVAATSSLSIGSGNTIAGDVSAGNVVMQDSSASITGNASVTAITLGYADRVQKTITCKPPGSGCSCVTNNSGYTMNGSAPGPVCAAAVTPPATPPTTSTIDHLTVSQPGVGLTCQAASVTVTACANAACTTLYTGGVSGTLTSSSSFSIPAGQSSVAASVRQLTKATVTLNAVASSANSAAICTNASTQKSGTVAANNGACSLVFSDSGFSLSIPSHASASTATLTLKALTNPAPGGTQSCVNMFSGPKTVNFGCVYSNPQVGNTPVVIAGTALGAACAPAGTTPTPQSVSLTFDSSGVATPPFTYADVGDLTINANYAPSTGTDAGTVVNSGGSDVIVYPASFGVVAGTAPGLAGDTLPFSVQALNSLGNVTPNFGNETSAESATIATKTTLINPNFSTGAAAANPDLAGSFGGVFTNNKGVATNVGLSWDQVGTIAVTANLTNTNGYLGGGFKTTGTGNIKVIPHHFTTVAPVLPTPTVPMSCDPTKSNMPPNCPGALPFVYSGEKFPLTISAMDKGTTVMSNYDGARAADVSAAKTVTLSAWSAANGSTAPAGTLAPSSIAASAFSAGMAVLSPANAAGTSNAPIAYTLKNTNAIAPPTTIYLRAIDADGATSLWSGQAYEQGLIVLNGRMLVANGYGSEVLPMPVKLQAQYLNASGAWVSSNYDSGSSYKVSDIVIANCKLKSGAACTSVPAVNMSASQTNVFVSGQSSFRLQAPGSSLGLDITLGAPASTIFYLPTAVAGHEVFGIYKSGPVIYQRELY